jgi:hypothetical protein
VEGLSSSGVASELQATNGLAVAIGGDTDGHGLLNILDSGSVSVTSTVMVLGGTTGATGTVIVSTSNPAMRASSLSVTGQLSIGRSEAGGGAGLLQIADGTVVVYGDVFVAANGAIQGRGILSVQVGNTLHNSGFISPGLSPGILTLDGDFEQDDTGMVIAEVAGPTPGTGHDQLIVTGAATMGGKLVLQFIDGYAPKSGDHFNVLNVTGAIVGEFASIDVLGLEPGALFQTALAGGVLTATAMNDTVALPTVSIRAVTKKAFEKGNRSAALLVSRNGSKASKANALTVNYTINGRAENGIDYPLLTGIATIPARKNAVTIKLKPFDDSDLEGPETVEFQIVPGTNYTNSLRSKAQVKIVDNERAGR